MYGSDFIFVIVGIVLLVINICLVVKFFQIAKNIRKLTDLYVHGVKECEGGFKYYKLPLEKDEEKTKEENERLEKLMQAGEHYRAYYNSTHM